MEDDEPFVLLDDISSEIGYSLVEAAQVLAAFGRIGELTRENAAAGIINITRDWIRRQADLQWN